jgi:parallel beta-helix repeat protein
VSRGHRVRRAFLALVALAALSCGSLGVLAGLGIWRPRVDQVTSLIAGLSPGAGQAAAPTTPPNPGLDEHDLAPQRQRQPMTPDQFDPVTSPKKMIGTQLANIVVLPDSIRMLSGDRLLWTGPFSSIPHYDRTISLDDIATLVARSPRPDWLRETQPGVFLLRAGLVQAPGTALTVAAPRVRELRMVADPYVFISGVSATGTFQGVKVTSWDIKTNIPDADSNHRRPFVAYTRLGAKLNVIDSEFCYLGSDSSQAYGVSWGIDTSGLALRSVFHHNLFGADTGRARDVTFQNSVFRDNAVYGLAPHTNSRKLTITGNEAYQNSVHGIIFSKGVVDSIVANNHSHDNGANGIMVDERSDNDVVQNNVVEHNHGSGIVVQGSSNVQVTSNVVAGNALGIRVNANELGVAVNNQVTGNQLSDNQNGINVYNGARGTALDHNVVRNSADAAMLLSEPTASQADTVVNAKKAAVLGNGESTLRELSVQGVDRGVVLLAGTSATISASQIAARDTAIDMQDVATLTLTGPVTTLTGARKAVVVNGTASLDNVEVRDVDRGVLLTPDARLALDAGSVVAREVGLEVQGPDGADRLTLRNSDIRAAQPVTGASVADQASNDLSITMSWLAIAGTIFLALALALHLIHRLWSRTPDVRHMVPPAEPEDAERLNDAPKPADGRTPDGGEPDAEVPPAEPASAASANH